MSPSSYYYFLHTRIHVEIDNAVNFVSIPIHLILCSTDIQTNILMLNVSQDLSSVLSPQSWLPL